MVEVVAALIWDKDRFLICQRPASKARALLWEFVGGKVEPGETPEQALVRECREELAIEVAVGSVFTDVIHPYPDITIHLTLFNCTIASGVPQLLEHNDAKWITTEEIPYYTFCPADTEILQLIRTKTAVKQQYATSANLNTRISIHAKYSTNQTGFNNWLISNYKIVKGMRVLELGCGTGEQWMNNKSFFADCSELVLSDLSDGMITTARKALGNHETLTYRVIDIADIPYDDAYFDIVIANMMLYHVPELPKALAEVRRVLKMNGSFCCATYGEHGIMEYLCKILSTYGIQDPTNKKFTLQNGQTILSSVFSKIECLLYQDSLEVTNADDMVEYIYSLSGMSVLNNIPRERVKEVLLQNMTNGVLHIPKEYGMFIAS